jgi:RNA polymerase sigma-B factor
VAVTEVRDAAAEDARLFRRWHHEGDAAAREELCVRYLPLARRLARRFGRDGADAEDLMQVACLALVKALERFDVDRGLRFSSYAVPTILGELKRHLRDTTWAISVPRDVHDHAMRIEAARRGLETPLGRPPRVVEIAEAAGVELEEALDALEALAMRTAPSLDQPGPEDGPSPAVSAEDPGLGRAEQRALLDDLVRALPRRERELLRLRFEEDLTQSEIGERLGLSQMHVSRLLRHSLERLRQEAQAQGRAGRPS